ncbi:MAG: hypothetical protein EXR62_07680 [Chloroflexi bacterium]|nr:hypothetical protein [Chloroflexota bacterium]
MNGWLFLLISLCLFAWLIQRERRDRRYFDYQWHMYSGFPGLLHRLVAILEVVLALTLLPALRLLIHVILPWLIDLFMRLKLTRSKRRIEDQVFEAVAEIERFDDVLKRRKL